MKQKEMAAHAEDEGKGLRKKSSHFPGRYRVPEYGDLKKADHLCKPLVSIALVCWRFKTLGVLAWFTGGIQADAEQAKRTITDQAFRRIAAQFGTRF